MTRNIKLHEKPTNAYLLVRYVTLKKKKPTQIGLFGLELQILCVPVKFRNNSYVNNVLRRPTLLQKVKPLNEIRNVIILYF